MAASIASHHRCNRDGHHSASVYDLGRLKARVHQLRAQPHSQALRCKILRSLSQLRRRIPVLPFIFLVDLDGAVQIVDDLYDQLSSQEQNARIQKWRDDHYRSSAACFSWIRQRSRVADALHQAFDAVPAQAIHSAEVVRVQSALWTLPSTLPALNASLVIFGTWPLSQCIFQYLRSNCAVHVPK